MATATTQRLKPPQSSSIISSSDNRPTVVLCSSKDDHLLSQDICILCGSLGKDDEGNLIACSQCGQCYHPYCVNIKGLKVVVSKGWRCLDCTVCETCGQPGDEGKLLLCDECELSYHTYCLNPPLEDVPPGAWKCHWCVVCQKCQSHSSGTNSDWQKNYTECGPCASKTTCPKCHTNYNHDDLILKCTSCSRWLHSECDSIYDEDDCELAFEHGYTCLLCRPSDEIPSYMVQRKTIHPNRGKHKSTANHHDNESKNHDAIGSNRENFRFKSANDCQSENKADSPRPQSAPLSVTTEINSHPIKRPASSLHFSHNDLSNENDENMMNSNMDDGAMKKSSTDPMEELLQGLHMVDGVYLSETGFAYIKSQKIEPTKRQRAKRGTKVQKLDDSNNIEENNKDDDEENKILDKTDDDGARKRVRKLSKAGIGGFSVRQRGVRVNKEDDCNYSLSNDAIETSTPPPPQPVSRDQAGETSTTTGVKPKRIRKKPKKKTNLLDQYPSYLQEAFFGKTLLTNELKSNEDKTNELNDCSNIDLENRDANKMNNEKLTSSGRLNNKFGDIKDELLTDSIDNQLLNKDGDLIDVFIGDSRATDDSSDNKRDFDLLSTDFNLDMVDPLDSKTVEDLLNGLGGTQQPNLPPPMNETNSTPAQPQIMSPSIRSISENSLHYEHSPQQMMPPQTPSPRMQFNRPQLQQHPMVQVSKVRPPMDPSRMQSADPYSIPPSTPRPMPMPMPQRSPFSPQSPFQPHPMSANSSTPPVTPRTPVEQPMYQSNNQHMPPMMQGQPMQQPVQYVESHQQHTAPQHGQYQQQMRPIQQQHPQQQQLQPHFSNQQQQQQQQPRIEAPKQNPTQDWEAEEALGDRATKSAVLYANKEHPNLKHQFRSSEERFKHIQKLWRQLAAEKRKPYVEKARENRSAAKVSKPTGDSSVGPKKSDSPLLSQPRGPMTHDNMQVQSQQVHVVQSPMMNQSQDTRWKQPMPVDSQTTRFAQSPHQQSHHMMHDPGMSQPMSPAIRPMMEPAHFEPSPQQMIPPQTPSPQMQFARPPMQPQQQHSMLQVSRVRPPPQPVDPYAIPPNTPRPMSTQQRSPFSPQSPFPAHPNVAASSTPPVTPRTPTEHSPMYQTNQHVPMGAQQPQVHPQQQPFIEQGPAQPMQQPNQFPQMRQPQYQNQPRMAAPVQQYNSNVVGASPAPMRGPMQPQLRSQQPMYQQQQQQQQQYRQAQPVRYVNQHQDPHQHVNSPMQQNLSPQHMQPQRMQRPVMAGQQHQPVAGPQRMMSQPRPMPQQPQHQAMMQGGHAPVQHMQPQQQPQQQQAPHLNSQGQHHNMQVHQMQQPQQQMPQPQPQQPLHPQQVQHQQQQQQPQQQMSVQQVPIQQAPSQQQAQQQQMHYQSMPMSNRIDTDDPTQLLDDEDALKDLGADFNILEFADPEPDKGGASTSSGKNNIDLDPEFEDFFDDRETLDEKRTNDPQTAMVMQQQPSQHQPPQQQHPMSQSQVSYQPHVHQQGQQPQQQQQQQQHPPPPQHMAPNQSFADNGLSQHHVGMQNTTMPNQHVQYTPQRQPQPQFVNQQQQQPQQQRPMAQTNQQYASAQPQVMRAQQSPVNQGMRMQQPPQQQQMGYAQNRPQHPQRYHSPVNHEQQQQMHHQQVQQNNLNHQTQGANQGAMSRGGPQYYQQTGYVDAQVQQQGGQMHHHQQQHHHHHQQPVQQQQMQYTQGPQQNVVHSNHQPQQNSQFNQPRRQFQPMPQQQQQHHHQNYGYQQQNMSQQPQQQGYQAIPQGQQMMKNPNDILMHDKNPIIGDPITSMEFTMYEPGSGANNEAANFFESNGPQDAGQEDPPVNIESGVVSMQNMVGDSSDEPVQLIEEEIIEQQQLIEPTTSVSVQGSVVVPDFGPKFVAVNSGRMSSCSKPAEINCEPNTTSSINNQPSMTLERTSSSGSGNNTGNSGQGQNQLLKQLLATCPAADGPNQERSSSTPANEPVTKVSITAPNHTTVAKQTPSGIPTISFQVDSANKIVTTATPMVQSSLPAPVRPATTNTTSFPSRPLITSTGTAPSSNFEIKTYNVGQQVPNNTASNPPTVMRVSQIPIPQTSMRSQTMDHQEVSNRPVANFSSVNQVESHQRPTMSMNIHAHGSGKPMMENPAAIAKANNKISAAKQRKSDYMAKRRADLEKEPTPPPREVKPKKRVRGPNKRSRLQIDNEESKTNDSTSNTSETSQQQLINGTPSAPPRKRVRKSQKAKSENDTQLSSLAIKLYNELPAITIEEPKLRANNNVGTLFACGDLNSKFSKLRGQFGQTVPVIDNLYDQSSFRGRRKIIGYYHEEFPKELTNKPVDALGERLIPRMLERECDSPSSIISASASDCEDSDVDRGSGRVSADDGLDARGGMYTPNLNKFKSASIRSQSVNLGHDNGNRFDINNNARAMSPSIPIHISLPVVQASLDLLTDMDQVAQVAQDDNNKENFSNSTPTPDVTHDQVDSSEPLTTADQASTSLNMRLKDHGNVSVTMTLTSEEAVGVKRVLSKLPNLIDGSEQSSATNGHNSSLEMIDSKTSLSGSLRLLTGAQNNQTVAGYADHSELKFDELNYVPMELGEENAILVNQTNDEPVDVKPEFCCRCKAIVIDRGIRKTINELPENIRVTLEKTFIITDNKTGELVFCSIDCYATSLMSTTDSKLDISKAASMVTEATILGLPTNQSAENQQPIVAEAIKRKWDGVLYTRWSPSYFEPTKTTSPASGEDIKESIIIDSSTFTPTSSSQLINHGDSSIDSNESDNSTSYSQSTSGKLANSLDSPFNNTQEVRTSFIPPGGTSILGKDIIPPWPEGLELIQVKPFKPAQQRLKSTYSKASSAAGAEPSSSSSSSSEKIIEMYEDIRKCVLCHEFGDGDSDGPARLLNFFIDGWVHLNCALWSLDVYELANGALMNVELACRKAMTCSLCRRTGATLKCFKPRCPNYYHFLCALKEKCSFYEDKSVQCRQHSKSSVKELTSFIVKRRVYINRDEQAQVAEMIQSEQHNVMRVGSLVFMNIGQLLPHQLTTFHDQNNIYPAGFKVIRYYWSYRRFNKRCKYLCTIEDNEGKPVFKILAQEFGYDDEEFAGSTPEDVWRPIICKIVNLRKNVPDTITTFPAYIRGDDLFGLNEPSIVRILESLPGVETLTDYDFKFGRSPLLELPLAINPTGCARSEPKLRTHFKRPYTIQTANNVTKSRLQSLNSNDSSSPYIKQFVHSKSSQYRKMKSEWRNNVVLARSRVQGLGLYAARDIEKHTMVIEYIGMLIRNEIAERYERIHEANNRGIYMFRLDEDRVIDATLAGGLARYINHSCNPNCVAEAVEIDRERKILIIANRKILKGEELGYDYKLAIEDDQHKISCLCGAPTCKKWMN